MNTILFDLDGTLLPMKNDEFETLYFGALAKHLGSKELSKENLIKVIWAGTIEMLQNDGSRTNEEVFWEKFEELTKIKKENFEQKFIDFYLNDFVVTKDACWINPLAKEIVDTVKAKGYTLVLATNPIFPFVSTKERIKWAGLDEKIFKLVTTYENSSHCKPNLKYYEEIIKKIHKQAAECLMIGNDVLEDMIASKLGIKTYLVTDCLINKKNIDINNYQNGTLEDLLEFVQDLPKL